MAAESETQGAAASASALPAVMEGAARPARSETPEADESAGRCRAWPTWMRHWELWLALAVGAFLRLWLLGGTPFGRDQASYLALARAGLLHGTPPITGLPFEIGWLSSPLDIYLALPFTALTRDPLPVVVSIALWNVLGVVLCYLFALRWFGRRVATLAALLFATSGFAVDYSRFVWQLNYIPPLVALWALTLYAGAMRGARGWLLPNVVLLTLLVLLHPSAALLAPLTLLALLLAPRRPRWWEYPVAALFGLVLLLPNFLWELLSGGADLGDLRQWATLPKSVDLSVLFRLYQALGGPYDVLQPTSAGHGLGWLVGLVLSTPRATIFANGTPYVALSGTYPLLALLAGLLFGLGWVVTTARSVRPVWREWQATAGMARRARLAAIWRPLRADVWWKAHLLLWTAVTLPVLLTIRHSGLLYAHYFLFLFPLVFVVSALGAQQVFERAARLARARPRLAWARLGVGAAVLALIVGQAAQSLLYDAALASARFDPALTTFVYTYAELRDANTRLGALQRAQGAARVFVMTSTATQAALRYLLVDEQPGRDAFDETCLTLPPATDGPALVVATDATARATGLLAALPNATRVAQIPMQGGDPLAVYRLAGPTLSLPGEAALTPVLFQTANGLAVQLEAAALQDPYVLRLRWRVVAAPVGQAADAGAQSVEGLRLSMRLRGADGSFLSASAWRDCQPTRWEPGATLFTWLRLATPSDALNRLRMLAQAAPGDTLLLQAASYSDAREVVSLGGLRLLSDWEVHSPFTILTPQAAGGGQTGGVGELGPEGVTLSASQVAALPG